MSIQKYLFTDLYQAFDGYSSWGVSCHTGDLSPGNYDISMQQRISRKLLQEGYYRLAEAKLREMLRILYLYSGAAASLGSQ